MATFIGLVNFTDQGIRNVKDSPDRYEAFKAMAEKVGVTVKGVYYTIGHYDMVLILEGSDEAAVTAMLKVGSLGNVRTETLRGFSLEEMRKIVGKLP
ncbi:MAG TPA: GYD domain-containing protein [Syntrophorhabdales bacterium]|nr:GYD domain-containing protein [Syntrophorhabdales bacterium]